MKRMLVTLAAGLALAHAGHALARDAKALTPAMVQQLDLVNRLVALGDAQQDPVLLLAAASLQKSLGSDAAALPSQSTSPDELVARAKALAGGRADILALVEQVSAAKPKGASWRFDAVTGRATYRF